MIDKKINKYCAKSVSETYINICRRRVYTHKMLSGNVLPIGNLWSKIENKNCEHKLSSKRISLVINTSTSAHSAVIRSSDEKTPKCAAPLCIRRKQSNRSNPTTHSIFDFFDKIGQNLSAFLYVPRASTKHSRTEKEKKKANGK